MEFPSVDVLRVDDLPVALSVGQPFSMGGVDDEEHGSG